jgi:hypothetical protein
MRNTSRLLSSAFVFTVFKCAQAAPGDWKPADGPLMTRWAKEVSPANVHQEYPRPQLVRPDWINLNGLWQCAVRPRAEGRPERFDREILVPFAIESALSGVMEKVGEGNRLWYRRDFEVPAAARGKRLLLHFGAVDWEATVWVNGTALGAHRGGYDPFSFDITDALRPSGSQEIVVAVWDPSDRGYQPRGKQVTNPEGIWYTSVTGIWQTVWLEPVPAVRIDRLEIVPDIDRSLARITAHTTSADSAKHSIALRASLEGRAYEAEGKPGEPIELSIRDAKLWSPDHPHLYDLTVILSERGAASGTLDRVTSYFGMRKIALGRDEKGVNRLFLNNRPLFQLGPLDQGWWPDGLYTAPTDAALRYDVEVTRKIGFNVARKHVKVEPDRWYYHCDQLGLMVWQDFPNGDRHIGGNDPDIVRSAESAENYRRELKAMIDARKNHPSIVAWVPFNEGWGQFDTDGVLGWVKEYDPTRLVDGPSGWTDRGSGDMLDIHRYPGPGTAPLQERRAVVLGEFGGLGLPLAGHLWWNERNWGYRTYTTREDLLTNYKLVMKKLHPLIGSGLAAAIYTQTTDVEGEVNGLTTYDRAVVKLGIETLAEIHRKLYEPPPVLDRRVVVPTSEEEPQTWRYATEKPAGAEADGWHRPDFDDSGWKEAPGGFGERSTPGTVVRSDWTTADIWIRRTFELDTTHLPDLHLRIHHDEDAEVYLNGARVAALHGYVTEYTDVELGEEAKKALKKGKNTLAVHCRQTGGGQYIDAGLVEVREVKERTD